MVEKPVANKNLEMEVRDGAEVRKFLFAAREAGVHEGAFYTLAIETGMRKGELCGLRWEDVDLASRRISVKRTLIKAGPEPIPGPPKVGKSTAIAISSVLACHTHHAGSGGEHTGWGDVGLEGTMRTPSQQKNTRLLRGAVFFSRKNISETFYKDLKGQNPLG